MHGIEELLTFDFQGTVNCELPNWLMAPYLIKQLAQYGCFFLTKVADDIIELVLAGIETFEKFPAFVCDHHIYKATIIFADRFFNKSFSDQPVHYSAGITHLIDHALPDLQSREWLRVAAS